MSAPPIRHIRRQHNLLPYDLTAGRREIVERSARHPRCHLAESVLVERELINANHYLSLGLEHEANQLAPFVSHDQSRLRLWDIRIFSNEIRQIKDGLETLERLLFLTHTGR